MSSRDEFISKIGSLSDVDLVKDICFLGLP